MARYKVRTRIAALEMKQRVHGSYKTGEVDSSTGKPVYQTEVDELGWYVSFEGSHESMYVGKEKPNGSVGDPATIILEW